MNTTLRRWRWIHKWTSLLCTLFLLVFCLTGLPLIFADEINHWVNPEPAYAAMPADAPRASIDPMVEATQRLRPRDTVVGVSIDPDEPQVRINFAPSLEAANADRGTIDWLAFDARTGALIGDSTRAVVSFNRIDQVLVDIHARLLAGDAGLLLMGGMGLLFVLSLISGAVLYGPFMGRVPFGTVRRNRSVNVKRLDLHNALGVIGLSWMLVVGFTGVLNALNDPLFDHWQRTVAAVTARQDDEPVPPGTSLSSVQAALELSRKRLPGLIVAGIDFPGADLNSSDRHYMIWARGPTLATQQIFTPTLVDVVDGRLDAVLPMPWYLRAIEVSRPFHFGDYGGMPLKIMWALFDLLTIIVLVTGLQLWLRQHRRGDR